MSPGRAHQHGRGLSALSKSSDPSVLKPKLKLSRDRALDSPKHPRVEDLLVHLHGRIEASVGGDEEDRYPCRTHESGDQGCERHTTHAAAAASYKRREII